MEPKKHDPIKWREHELILVTVYCLLGIAGAWWNLFEYTGIEQRQRWGWNFKANHVYFDFFINYLLPQTGLLIAFYLFYFWMNLYILPRLVQADAAEPGFFRVAFSLRGRIEVSGSRGQTLKRFLWGLLNAIV